MKRLHPLGSFSALLALLAVTALPVFAAPPETWFAGPDPTFYPIVPGSGGQRYVEVANWNSLPSLPGGLLSCDSLATLPSLRTPRKTFYEIFGNRIYVRSENDTVHMNSWVVLTGGGSDFDSPYSVAVAPGEPRLLDTLTCAGNGPPWVVRPDGANGSPIGFRMRVPIRLDPGTIVAFPAQSGLFPVFDPGSVFRLPTISGYSAVIQSGKAYAMLRAQDGDGVLDPFPGGSVAVQIADSVDLGLATSPASLAIRAKVLTFYVNRNPVLLTAAPTFAPKPPETNGGAIWVFPASRILAMNLLSSDPDPLPPGSGTPPGGPATPAPLRFTVTVVGRNAANQSVSYTTAELVNPVVTINLPAVAPQIVSDDLVIRVNLCDCTTCSVPGQGRCVEYSIPARIEGPVATLVSLVSAKATPQQASLRWIVRATGPARIERRTVDSDWQVLADRWPDANHEVALDDEAVTPGTRYGYRLTLTEALGSASDIAWIEIPRGPSLALEGVRPNPAVGERTLSFALPDDRPATITIVDASGRRVWGREALGAGRHVWSLGHDFAPGVYVVRLAQEGRVLTSKFAVMR